jgi:hypothetical protein
MSRPQITRTPCFVSRPLSRVQFPGTLYPTLLTNQKLEDRVTSI